MSNNENTSDVVPAPPELPPAAPQETEIETVDPQVLKKRVYLGFAGIMALGLAVAGAYISGRLYADHAKKNTFEPVAVKTPVKPAPVPTKAVASSEAPKPEAQPVPQPVATPAPAVVTEAPAVAERKTTPPAPDVHPANPEAQHNWTVSNPQPGERYLQLAALGPHATDSYIPELQSKGYRPIVAPGPEEKVFRILIGPFQDRNERKRQQEALDSAGIESFVRSY